MAETGLILKGVGGFYTVLNDRERKSYAGPEGASGRTA